MAICKDRGLYDHDVKDTELLRTFILVTSAKRDDNSLSEPLSD